MKQDTNRKKNTMKERKKQTNRDIKQSKERQGRLRKPRIPAPEKRKKKGQQI